VIEVGVSPLGHGVMSLSNYFIARDDEDQYGGIGVVLETPYFGSANLLSTLGRNDILNLDCVVFIFHKLARTLEESHNQKVAFRDLKSENIALTINESERSLIPIIFDLESCKEFRLREDINTHTHVHTEQFLGTGHFRALLQNRRMTNNEVQKDDVLSLALGMWDVIRDRDEPQPHFRIEQFEKDGDELAIDIDDMQEEYQNERLFEIFRRALLLEESERFDSGSAAGLAKALDGLVNEMNPDVEEMIQNFKDCGCFVCFRDLPRASYNNDYRRLVDLNNTPNENISGHFSDVHMVSVNWTAIESSNIRLSFSKKKAILQLDFQDEHYCLFEGRECNIDIRESNDMSFLSYFPKDNRHNHGIYRVGSKIIIKLDRFGPHPGLGFTLRDSTFFTGTIPLSLKTSLDRMPIFVETNLGEGTLIPSESRLEFESLIIKFDSNVMKAARHQNTGARDVWIGHDGSNFTNLLLSDELAICYFGKRKKFFPITDAIGTFFKFEEAITPTKESFSTRPKRMTKGNNGSPKSKKVRSSGASGWK